MNITRDKMIFIGIQEINHDKIDHEYNTKTVLEET